VSATLPIIVSGATGRMGRALEELAAAAPDLHLVGGIAPDGTGRSGAARHERGYPTILPVEAAPPLLADARVLIDFSAPEHLEAVLSLVEQRGGPSSLVIGTTGLDHGLQERLASLEARFAIIVEANFSVGVQLLLALAARAAAVLPAAEYDAEIVEAHHRAKVDSPSGTALALAAAVARSRDQELQQVRRDGRSGRTGARPPGEIGIHAVRGGTVIGEHRVLFLGHRERFELAHQATDRAVFAEGALRAARWLAFRPPGRYSLREALGVE
jgi:4-hydroxy-tetrahydrodipicolinate reductase